MVGCWVGKCESRPCYAPGPFWFLLGLGFHFLLGLVHSLFPEQVVSLSPAAMMAMKRSEGGSTLRGLRTKDLIRPSTFCLLPVEGGRLPVAKSGLGDEDCFRLLRML